MIGFGKEMESVLGDEVPEKTLARETDDGVYMFYFITPARLSGRIGTPVIHFVPPELCPGKLLIRALEGQPEECGAPQGTLLH